MRTRTGTLLPAACLVAALAGVDSCRGDISSPGAVDRRVAAISILQPAAISLPLNHGAALSAELRNAAGEKIWGDVTWTSSDWSIVAISGTTRSLQTSIAPAGIGTAIITARSGTFTASIKVEVRAPGPPAVVRILSPATLSLGTASTLAVSVADSDGVLAPGAVPTFASSDSSVISVSEIGVMIARQPGTATLSARAGGRVAQLAITVTPAAHAFVWTAADGLLDLGVAGGFVASKALAVSDAGHVAGTLSSVADSLSRAFVWKAGAPMRELFGFPGGGQSGAYGVNSAGRVVGWATSSAGVRHAVAWSAAGIMEDLGTLPGDVESEARAINDAGQVVGWSRDAAGNARSFTWSATTGMRVVAGTGAGAAYAINRAGAVGGESDGLAYLWNPGSGARRLQPIMGDYNMDVGGRVTSVSGDGDAVGLSTGCSNSYSDVCSPPGEEPALWPRAGETINLRVAPGAGPPFAIVSGINTTGHVVGTSGSMHALFWNRTGSTRDLGFLPGRTTSAATAINESGVVAGWSGNP